MIFYFTTFLVIVLLYYTVEEGTQGLHFCRLIPLTGIPPYVHAP
jgi:hypothetical protein